MRLATETVTCPSCGSEIELSQALTKDVTSKILASEQERHKTEMAQFSATVEAQALSDIQEARKRADELADRRLSIQIESLREDSDETKKELEEIRQQYLVASKQLREANKSRENLQIEMERQLSIDELQIREEAEKTADERQRLNIAARDKTISDLQRALSEAQRKAEQGSQQLQGEIMELDLESELESAFRDDDIVPVAKGAKGADILHNVKTPSGSQCGTILWEIKRTKNWVDGWIPKLKEDLRSQKANIPIIVTETMPKSISLDMGQLNGVWICRPHVAVILGTLLRKSIIDAGLQKSLASDRGSKADALYNFVTSHEFTQQIESMVDTYQTMYEQVSKERTYFNRFWAEREAQAQRLLLGTVHIIGSMQGQIGRSSMPSIKGIDLPEATADDILEVSGMHDVSDDIGDGGVFA
jgi:hypothetical protein